MTINENAGQQTVNLTGITAGGGETQTLTVTASSNNTALINPTITYTSPNSTGTLTFTPAANSFGTATITVTVMDNGGTLNGGVDKTSVQFTVTVNQVNVPPTIDTPSNLTIDENAGEQTVNLTGITSGGGGNVTLTVTASSNNSALVNPSVNYTSPNSTGTLTFTPAANSFGMATITVTVSDDGGANTTSVQFLVTVNFVNAAPTINTPANVTINENAGQQTVNLTGITAGDDETQTLTVTASSNNTALINPTVTYTSPNSTGTLTFTPAANSFGTATITVTVMDSGGTANGGVDKTSVQFTVTVNQVAATVTRRFRRLGHQGHHRAANRRGRAPAAPRGAQHGPPLVRDQQAPDHAQSSRVALAERRQRHGDHGRQLRAGDDLRLRDELHDHVRPGDHDGRSRDGDHRQCGDRDVYPAARRPAGRRQRRRRGQCPGPRGSSATTSPVLGAVYNIFDDINGDGVVDINDTNLVGSLHRQETSNVATG